jgi:hypothetical protein
MLILVFYSKIFNDKKQYVDQNSSSILGLRSFEQRQSRSDDINRKNKDGCEN